MNKLQGKIAVITGANSGIGKAIAIALAREKVGLILISRDKTQLRKLKNTLKQFTNSVDVISVDLSKVVEVKDCIETILKLTKSVDFLIHSAGIIKLNTFEEAHGEDLDKQFYINERAPYLLTQGLLPLLKKTKGKIVFLNSSAANHPNRHNGQYAASKAALKATADSIRKDVNVYDIQVTSIYPGRTATRMQEQILQYENRKVSQEDFIQPEDIAQSVMSVLHMNRTAQIADIVIMTAK